MLLGSNTVANSSAIVRCAFLKERPLAEFAEFAEKKEEEEKVSFLLFFLCVLCENSYSSFPSSSLSNELRIVYSMASSRASQDASMMFSLTPTEPK